MAMTMALAVMGGLEARVGVGVEMRVEVGIDCEGGRMEREVKGKERED